jgi:hypothetical protein
VIPVRDPRRGCLGEGARCGGCRCEQRRQQAFLDDIGHHVGAVAGARLQPDVFNVTLDSARRDAQFLSNFLGRAPVGDKIKYFGLTISELSQRRKIANGHVLYPCCDELDPEKIPLRPNPLPRASIQPAVLA